ncbi:HNRNPM [Cordylochernes scorpioides]|uniref:HNRNPM n=1 Tax=Cordylochernes scorpioides TaxID=51811 RepID=A0ABY6K4K2_9ARAC|nr:HNRNPM [Cordylochernes scorpioides]
MAGNMGMNAPMSMMNSGGGMGGMPSSMGMGTPAAGGMGSMGMGNSSMLGGAASSGYSSGLAPNSSMAAPSPGMGLGMAPASSSAMGYGNDRYDGGRGGGLGNDSFSSGQSDTVLLRNLPTTVTWQMLKDRFRDVGKLLPSTRRIDLLILLLSAGDIRHVDLKGRGMAVMRFGSERDARRAVGRSIPYLLVVFGCWFGCQGWLGRIVSAGDGTLAIARIENAGDACCSTLWCRWSCHKTLLLCLAVNVPKEASNFVRAIIYRSLGCILSRMVASWVSRVPKEACIESLGVPFSCPRTLFCSSLLILSASSCGNLVDDDEG